MGLLKTTIFKLQYVLTHNDKNNNEMIPGAVQRPPGICLTAEESPGKLQLGDHLMKGLCEQSSPQNVIPYLQMTSVGSHSMLGMEKEEKDKVGRKSISLE